MNICRHATRLAQAANNPQYPHPSSSSSTTLINSLPFPFNKHFGTYVELHMLIICFSSLIICFSTSLRGLGPVKPTSISESAFHHHLTCNWSYKYTLNKLHMWACVSLCPPCLRGQWHSATGQVGPAGLREVWYILIKVKCYYPWVHMSWTLESDNKLRTHAHH